MAGVTGLVLAPTGLANADVVTNNLAGATTVNVAPGNSVSVVFKLTPTSGDGDVDGCNALGEGKTELNVSSVPAAGGNSGLSISPAKKNFQTCKKSASVTFSVGANVADGASYAVSAVMSGGQQGSKYTNSSFTLKVVKGLKSTTLGLAPSAATVDYGTATLPLSATLLTGTTPVAGKTVVFSVEGEEVGRADTDASGVATTAVPIGTRYNVDGQALETVTSYAGDATHATSSAFGTLTIERGEQAALTIDQPTSGSFGQTLPITSSGGTGDGATTYSASGACSLAANGTSVYISSGTGTCTINATKSGGTNYEPVSTSRSFTVGKAAQPTLSVTSPSAGTFGDLLPIEISGGAGTGALSFSHGTSDACAVEAGQLRITQGSGTCNVTATKAGDGSYETAVSAPKSVTIAQAAQTLTLTGPTAGTFGESYPITFTNGAGTGAVTFSAGESTACAVEGTQVRITSGTGTCKLTGTKAGDRDYAQTTSAPLSVEPNKATATLSVSGLAPVYDGTAKAVTVTTNPAGLSGVTVTYDNNATAPRNAGTYAVSASLENLNYAATQVNETLVISPKELTGAISATGKEYDGTTTATVQALPLTGVAEGDAVTLQAINGRFATAGADDGKTVTADISLVGANGNYRLTQNTATALANISKRTVTGSVDVADRDYDRTTAATITPLALDRKVGSDDVALRVDSGSFPAAGVGSYDVTATVSLTGAAKDNYRLTSTTATDTAVIRALALTATITAAHKPYDGGTAAVVTPDVRGILLGDDVTTTVVTPVFADKNAENGKIVTASLQLAGLHSGNYTLAAGPYSTTANITKLPTTGSFTADTKVYDGTTTATVLVKTVTSRVGADDVKLSLTAAFADKNVGTGKAVSAVSPSLTGGDAVNYTLGAVADATADITALPTTGSFTADNKVYDGTRDATVLTKSVTSRVGNDAVELDLTAVFADKNVGNGKAVSAVSPSLTGADATNYALGNVANATADITAKVLTVTASSHQVIKGAAVPTITASITGFVPGEESTPLTTAPSCSTTYTPTGSAFSYPTTCEGLAAQNYTASYVSGLVTVSYSWSGFFQPIDTKDGGKGKDSTVTAGTIFNKAKAGSSIPVKFSLGGNQGMSIFMTGYPKVTKVACDTAAVVTDPIEEFSTATTTGLAYDASTGQYNYTWKTATTLANTCQRLEVKLADGNSYYAFFTFTK